jgi:hypothetical protein
LISESDATTAPSTLSRVAVTFTLEERISAGMGRCRVPSTSGSRMAVIVLMAIPSPDAGHRQGFEAIQLPTPSSQLPAPSSQLPTPNSSFHDEQ